MNKISDRLDWSFLKKQFFHSSGVLVFCTVPCTHNDDDDDDDEDNQ